jgi:hypothetical protein
VGLGGGQGAQAGEEVGDSLGLRDGIRGDHEDELGDADGDEAAYLFVQALELLGDADLYRPADLGWLAAYVGAVPVEHGGEFADLLWGSAGRIPDRGVRGGRAQGALAADASDPDGWVWGLDRLGFGHGFEELVVLAGEGRA